MASLSAQYIDGVLQTQTPTSDSLTGNSKNNNSVVSSDTFLSLLVAEMQNQDPLEPTSNTEWVSQYATFTQVEQIGEMASTLDVMRANSLVGKEVIMKVQSASTGEITYTRGTVDYITMEEGEALLNINGSNYSLKDLDTVATNEYFDAYDIYSTFIAKVGALPSSTNKINLSYKNVIQELYDMYTGMSDYQKDFVKKFATEELKFYEDSVKILEDLGVKFGKEEEKETTLDDLLGAFNSKMDNLLGQMTEINNRVEKLENKNETE